MIPGLFYCQPEGDPYFNMLFDDWLFEQVRSDPQLVCLRLYSWAEEAITIGYNQKLNRAVDPELLEGNIPIIRRVTGGRAIFHDPSELTFTLAANLEILDPEWRSLSATVSLISEALVEIFQALGLSASWQKKSDRRFVESSEKTLHACFDSVSRYEITCLSGKIAGGAQRRLGSGFIHQGSLKVNGVRSCAAIGQEALPAPILPGGSLLPLTILDFKEPMRTAFSRRLSVEFLETPMSPDDYMFLERRLKDFPKLSLSRRPVD